MLNHVLLFQLSNPSKDLDSDEDKWWWKDNCDKLLSTVHCKVLLSVNRFCLKRAEKPFVISKMNFEISILNQSSVDHYLQQWLLCRSVKLQMKSIRLRRQRVQLISVFRIWSSDPMKRVLLLLKEERKRKHVKFWAATVLKKWLRKTLWNSGDCIVREPRWGWT